MWRILLLLSSEPNVYCTKFVTFQRWKEAVDWWGIEFDVSSHKNGKFLVSIVQRFKAPH